MKKLVIVMLSFIIFTFVVILALNMRGQSERDKIGLQIESLTREVLEITPEPESPIPEEASPESSPAVSDPMKEWIQLSDEFYSLDGFHSPEWKEIVRLQFRGRHLLEWKQSDIRLAISIVNDAQPVLKQLESFIHTHQKIPAYREMMLSTNNDVSVLKPLYGFGRLYYVKSILEAAAGKREESFKTILRGLQFANAINNDDPLDNGAFDIYQNTYALMLEALQEAHPASSLSHPQLEAYFVLTRDAHQRAHFMQFYQDITVFHAFSEYEMDKFNSSSKGFRKKMGEGISRREPAIIINWFRDATSNREQKLQTLDDSYRIAKTAQKLRPGPLYRIRRQARGPDDLINEIQFVRQGNFEARLDLSILGLLVEDHNQRTGSYPKTLQELEMPFAQPIPKDVFTGKNYTYTITEDGFDLYSLGYRQEDLGGQHKAPRHSGNLENYNIVWRGKNYYYAPDPNAPTIKERNTLLDELR